MNAYAYLTKMRMMVDIAYRFDVFAATIGNLVLMSASVFLWKAAYKGSGNLAAGAAIVAEDQMILYAIMAVLLSSLFVTHVEDTIHGRIREGNIAIDFIRPIHLLGCYLAEDLGSFLGALMNRTLPLFVFAWLCFTPPLPASFAAFVLFAISFLFGYAILWLISAWVGLMAFWVIDLGNLGLVKEAIIRVLSGSLIPLWFFPPWLQTVSAFLPFQYTYQTLIAIYIGKLPVAEALRAIAIQSLWVALLVPLVLLTWKKAQRNTLVQGG